QCPGANSSPNRNVGSGKMRRASAPLLVTMRRGFLLPRQMAGAQCSATFKKHRDAPQRIPANGQDMEKNAGFMKALKCRECGRAYPLTANHVCEFDFGPLEVVYDYDRIKRALTRETITSRAKSMWRYRELLPIVDQPTVGTQVGFTPLVKAERLAKRLGIRELWIKNDTVNYPSLSFKDRVVSVALSRAKELGFTTVACASTGNLANSVAANAAAAGMKAYVFIPSDLEQGKILNS